MLSSTRPSGSPDSNKPDWNAYFVARMRSMKPKSLERLANPHRLQIHQNEGIAVFGKILEAGVRTPEEASILLATVTNEQDRSITKGDRSTRQNNAIIRGEAALALAKYGLKTKEFKHALLRMIKTIAQDPLLMPQTPKPGTNREPSVYLDYFIKALTIANQ